VTGHSVKKQSTLGQRHLVQLCERALGKGIRLKGTWLKGTRQSVKGIRLNFVKRALGKDIGQRHSTQLCERTLGKGI